MNTEEIKARILELRDDVNRKFEEYLKIEGKLTQEPLFIDKKILDEFNMAKLEWQESVNKHNSFLNLLKT